MGPPANLPNFDTLAKEIAQGTGLEKFEHEPVDTFLGRLGYSGVEVHKRAAEILLCDNPQPTDLHHQLLRLFGNPDSVRIVTTNFDDLFEQASSGIYSSALDVYTSPVLPLGDRFKGIVHVHGSLKNPDEIVLTDEDFGRGYLVEDWARRFLVALFYEYNVLFIGYRHDDTVMRYLGRALPPGQIQKRFVLTGDNQGLEQWGPLRIEPIVYPNGDGSHSALHQGISGLADFMNRGVLEWRTLLRTIAQLKPSLLTQEDVHLIEDALSDVTRTSFFTGIASDPDWIIWLDNRGKLDSLFSPGQLTGTDALLSKWLASKFAVSQSSHLFRLIARHNIQLNPVLWQEICRTISTESGSPEKEVLDKWVSILVNNIPSMLRATVLPYILDRLANKCAEHRSFDGLLEIVSALPTGPLPLETGGRHFEEQSSSVHYAAKQIWINALEPNLKVLAKPLLSLTVDKLRKRYATISIWRNSNRDIDTDSWGRSAIEPHSQDRHDTVTDALIDIARDCLTYLAQNNNAVVRYWCYHLVASDAPLLRRLAIHTINHRGDLSANDKTDWLLAHANIHELATHHEIYQVLKGIYSDIDREHRQKLISVILAYEWPHEEDLDKDRHTAYHRFSVLNWLHQADPDCDLIQEELSQVFQEHPDFQAREYPDLNYWSGSGIHCPESPWPVELLLSKSGGEWYDEISSFQSDSISGPNQEGLLEAISEAVTQNSMWGFELASAMAANENWTSRVWEPLFKAWSGELNSAKHKQVLSLIDEPQLFAEHSRLLTELLLSLVKNGGVPYVLDLLVKMNHIAARLKGYIIQDRFTLSRVDWLMQAINHPAGVLAQYWLHSLAISNRRDSLQPILVEECLTALSTITKDQTLVGQLGKVILGQNTRFLFSVDFIWTNTNLLHMFKSYDKIDEIQAIWSGFLHGQFTAEIADLMKKDFLELLPRIKQVFPEEELRNRFISRYVEMIAYFVDDPFEEWIPRFFNYGNTIEYRRQFAQSIGIVLRNMDEIPRSRFWGRVLRKYWRNRLQGVPPPALDDAEIEEMLNWLPYLGDQFSEAVQLVTQTPGAHLDAGLLVHNLQENSPWQSYPEATAELLIHLGNSAQRLDWRWHLAKDLIDNLLQIELRADLKGKLEELQARLDLP